MTNQTYKEIERLEAEKNALIKETADKGNAKFEVLSWNRYLNKRKEIQERLDDLYRVMDWD